MTDNYELTADEVASYERDGYLVRHGVFTADEVAAMAAASETLVEELTAGRDGHRLHVGSYVFDPDFRNSVIIKWEGDSDVVHGIEPLAHLSPELGRWGLDDRLVHPMRAIVGDESPELFTEKLNLKRPHHGGPNPLHQDYPYWLDSTDDPSVIATTIVYLDDSDTGNGCTWVVPGSHKSGMWQTRTDTDTFGQNELDTEAYPDIELVPVEVSAGSTVTFGSLMVHQSTPNTSDRKRRTLLYSYQPPGRDHMVEGFKRFGARTT